MRKLPLEEEIRLFSAQYLYLEDLHQLFMAAPFNSTVVLDLTRWKFKVLDGGKEVPKSSFTLLTTPSETEFAIRRSKIKKQVFMLGGVGRES